MIVEQWKRDLRPGDPVRVSTKSRGVVIGEFVASNPARPLVRLPAGSGQRVCAVRWRCIVSR